MLTLAGHRDRRHQLAPATVDVGGRAIPLVVRRTARAKRLILRLCPVDDALILTLPPRVGVADGLAFVARERERIAALLDRRPARMPFVDGAVILLRGAPHRIVAAPGRDVRVADGVILVGGREDRLAATLGRWLRRQALAELTQLSEVKAARLNGVPRRPLGRVRVKEMRTRWGSCTPKGDLNYAWRLILAPPFVLDYVVAHEVAHLARAGHDRAFWTTCAHLAAADPAPARAWLRDHGSTLLRYG
ncbi:MAG: SprT family zinc-dependent metalloprotease [Rhodospirillales bacterium]